MFSCRSNIIETLIEYDLSFLYFIFEIIRTACYAMSLSLTAFIKRRERERHSVSFRMRASERRNVKLTGSAIASGKMKPHIQYLLSE